jgi:peptidyl-prolyl cis-trans isomerase SurA
MLPMMNLRPDRTSALRMTAMLVLAPALLATGSLALAQAKPAPASAAPSSAVPAGAAPASPYGGVTVNDIVARVNDQIISQLDYDRAMKEMDDEARQRGASLQQIAEGHKELLRNLIDQQLWLSKGKELGVTGETELVKQLDEIRKKYNLETMDDLEKAAREQGVSYEDFKANIRNGLITQEVMRDEVGRRVQITPGEAQRYFEAHKQDYVQPESIHLSEILVSTGGDETEKLATAKAKADDLEAKLKAGGDFDKLARSSSDGPTAAEGGDLGKFQRGALAKVLEDSTFSLKAGQYTEPIRTKQGYVILKVNEHITGGIPAFKDVEPQVEESFYMSRMEPAIRAYLTTLREESFIDIKPGYVDSGASAKQTKPIYSSYTPPAPKKKKKAQRTRFRETDHGYRTKPAAVVPVAADTTPAKPATAKTSKSSAKAAAKPQTMKAGKKEKIRYGQAPRETLPNAAETKTEDAGALPKVAENEGQTENPLQATPPVKKTRYTERAKLPKAPKSTGPKLDSFTPAPPDAAEVADRQTQSAPLGLAGDTSKKKKKSDAATTTAKTRKQQQPRKATDNTPVEMTPAAPAAGAPAPATAPKTTSTTAPVPSSAPQQTPTSPDPPLATTPASEPPH